MKTKKKAASKKSTPRASRVYEFTPKGQKMYDAGEITGDQPKLIAQTLSRKGKATSSQLAEAIDGKVETRQPVTRVVGYYLTTWKSDGIVKVVKEAKAPKAPKAPKTESSAATA